MTDPIGTSSDPVPTVKLTFQMGVIGFSAEGPAGHVHVFMQHYLAWVDKRLSSNTGEFVAAIVQAQGATKQ